MATDRGGEAQRAGDLVGALFGGSAGRGLSAAQQAARAWYAANGDREREHTTGVWLRKSGRAGQDPVLVVEVDANWLAVELATNKDLYLARLSYRGVRASDIRFQVGKPRAPRRPSKPAVSSGASGAFGGHPLSPMGLGTEGDAPQTPQASQARQTALTSEERSRVERACADLPDGLKQSVSRAMCASFIRAKDTTTQ